MKNRARVLFFLATCINAVFAFVFGCLKALVYFYILEHFNPGDYHYVNLNEGYVFTGFPVFSLYLFLLGFLFIHVRFYVIKIRLFLIWSFLILGTVFVVDFILSSQGGISLNYDDTMVHLGAATFPLYKGIMYAINAFLGLEVGFLILFITRRLQGHTAQEAKIRLVRPHVRYERAYREMILDWEKDRANLTPYTLREPYRDFPALVKKLHGFSKGIGVEKNRVPSSDFWLVNEKGDILGVLNIRHYLNERYRKVGGHIGYGVPPAHRGKGYGTLMLHLSLKKAKKLGIKEALLTIYPENTASKKVILRNGGVPSGKGELKGKPLAFYTIKLNK